MTKLLDPNFIDEQFKKEGYTLLSKYKGNRYKLDFICPKGHKYSMTYGSWKKGKRCKKCAAEKSGRNSRYDFTEIKKAFEKEGFLLLSKQEEYISNKKSKLKFKCPNNHEHSVTWSSWQKGIRCKFCAIDRRRLTLDFVRSVFEKENYKLFSQTYVNNAQLLDFECPKGHIYKMSYADWSMGKRCGICANNKQYSIENLRCIIATEGYKLLSDTYTNNKGYLQIECPHNHTYNVKWNVWQTGHRCPYCFKRQSNEELEVGEYLRQVFGEGFNTNNKKIIYPYELDLVIPSKKIAVEYCGVYWHSEANGTGKHYHLNKLDLCNKVGYRLITIFEDEWLENKTIVKARLAGILGKSVANKINARDCVVKHLSATEAREFCSRFHLQGYGSSAIKLGLFYNDLLLSVMTFAAPNIAKGGVSNRKGYFELNRFCTDYNYLVRGGASKLLTFFIRNYPVKQIYSYADRRWSEGGLYYSLGFKFVQNTEPNYWYVKNGKRLHRFNFRKSTLRKFNNYDLNLPEWKIMLGNKYYRLWDCGSMKFVMKVN